MYTCDGQLVIKEATEDFEKEIINMRDDVLDYETEKKIIEISNKLKSNLDTVLPEIFLEFKLNGEPLDELDITTWFIKQIGIRLKISPRYKLNRHIQQRFKNMTFTKTELNELEEAMNLNKTINGRQNMAGSDAIDALIKYYKFIENLEIGFNEYKTSHVWTD